MAWQLLVHLSLTHQPGAKALKSSILVFLALLALSPVLRTLTAATSSDSIWALSASLFILNALLADYTSAKRGNQIRERSAAPSTVILISAPLM